MVALTSREIDRIGVLFGRMRQAISESIEARRVRVQVRAVVEHGRVNCSRRTAVSASSFGQLPPADLFQNESE
jgi:hypothetical protein